MLYRGIEKEKGEEENLTSDSLELCTYLWITTKTLFSKYFHPTPSMPSLFLASKHRTKSMLPILCK